MLNDGAILIFYQEDLKTSQVRKRLIINSMIQISLDQGQIITKEDNLSPSNNLVRLLQRFDSDTLISMISLKSKLFGFYLGDLS